MLRRVAVILVVAALTLTVAVPTLAAPVGGRPASGGAVYVTSQGLYYDTFGTTDLPWNPQMNEDSFQLIDGGATEFGPGDPGYRGGRWWEDTNGNGYQDAGDHFFQCPLLGPGYAP